MFNPECQFHQKKKKDFELFIETWTLMLNISCSIETS